MLSRKPLFRVASIAFAFSVLYIVLFSPFGPNVAMADVAAKFKEAHTLTYTMTVLMPNGHSMVSKVYMGEQGRSRIESGNITVTISRDQQTLILFPMNHSASQLNLVGQPANARKSGSSDMIDQLRHLGDHDSKAIGEKIIDGIAAKGFTTTYGGLDATVWADAKTAMPLRIETMMPAVGKDVRMVISDFKLDVPIDDSLFSMDLPTGYTLTKTTKTLSDIKLGKVEDEVARLMRDYAKLNDNHFPDSLSDWALLMKGFGKIEDVAQSDIPSRIGGISGRLFSLPHGFGYTPKGVLLGEKDKLVFWIKPAADAQVVRGVYGDLRVTDVPVEQLPTTQPTP